MPLSKHFFIFAFFFLCACQSNPKYSKDKIKYDPPKLQKNTGKVEYTPPYEPPFTSTGTITEAQPIEINGIKAAINELPIQYLENHFGKSIYFNPIDFKYPKPFGDRLTKEELRNWLSIPQVLYGTDEHKNAYETWLFPNQDVITFEPYSSPYHGQVWQRDSDLCFRYVKNLVKCGKLYRSGGGFYYADPGYPEWYFFKSKTISLTKTTDEFIELLKSDDAAYAFIDFDSSPALSNTQTIENSKIKNPNDIAIIISNSDYNQKKSDIPNIAPAQNDGNAIFNFLTRVKGLSPNNIIRLNNATQSQMVNAFGSYRNHKGSAFNWVKPGKSNLYVYYAGHGAPSEDGGLLIPTDAKYDSVELNGYPVSQLLTNLSKIPAKSITVMLESCFSGVSAGGTVVANASPIYIQKPISSIPENINLITAAGPNQIASWQKDKRQSLFTKYLLAGLKGQADSAEYGNGDGKVDQQELQRFLDDTMTYEARRGYGREQSAKVQFTNGFVF